MSENFELEFQSPGTDATALMHSIRALVVNTLDIFSFYSGEHFSGRMGPNEQPGLLVVPLGPEVPPHLIVMAIDDAGIPRPIGHVALVRKTVN